eukprot:12188775-Karenia_brevis.AAC.1
MDGWTYDDWALLPPDAFIPIAIILQQVEQGASWPTSTLHTNPHSLCKNVDIPHSALSWRSGAKQGYATSNHGSASGVYLRCTEGWREWELKMLGILQPCKPKKQLSPTPP